MIKRLQGSISYWKHLPVLVVLGLLFAWLPVDAHSAAGVLEFDAGITSKSPGLITEYWVDPDNESALEDAIGVPDDRWVRSQQEAPSLGFTADTYWFRFKAHSLADKSLPLLLEVSYPSLDDIRFYVLENGQLIDQFHTGDTLPFSTRRVVNRNFILPVEFEPRQTLTFYIRVHTEGAVQLPIALRSQTDYNRHEQFYLVFYGIYFGVMIIMVLYNLTLYSVVKDISYFYYVITTGSFAMFQACLYGFAFQFLWPENPQLNQYAITLFMCLFGLAGSFFAVNFLRLKQHFPPYFYVFMANAVVLTVLIIGIVTDTLSYNSAIRASTLVAFLESTTIMGIGFHLLVIGYKEARFFALAWTLFLLFIAILVLNKAGMVPLNMFTEHAAQFGHILQVLLLSFALADRINMDRQAREEAQQLAHENEKMAREEQARYLELKFKSQEEEMQARQKIIQAEAESKAKSEFLATMSHEIRTPMNGVLGMAELLQETELKTEQRQYLDVIESSGKALLNIINDILDYSKIEAGKMEIEAVDFDLDKLILDCASVFSLTAEKKGIELLSSLRPETPTFIKSDPTRLRQILLNLLGNAFKFTTQGRIKLRVETIASDAGRHTLRFEVQDTGIGISDEQQRKLFSAFSQADTSTTRQFGGTGLGLSISKRLTELMGGEIGVTSQEGEGSVFWFTIQCEDAEQAFVEEHFFSGEELRGKRILFVDDSPDFIQVVSEQAQTWGMEVDIAYYGEEALEKMEQAAAANRSYDIVSLDMNMPGLDGLEVAQKMSASPRLNRIPRLLLTALRQVPDRESLKAAGIEVAVQKPASARALRDTIQRLITGHSTDREKRQQERSTQLISALKGLHVMIVEDNAVNQMVVKGMLKRLGMSFDIADDGLKALALYEENPQRYSLILMDCEMPNMDGYQATERMRAFETATGLPATPIVALTAHAVREHQDRAYEAGMNDHITKPIEAERLKQVLAAFLVPPANRDNDPRVSAG
ncbi:MAG: response regulator [Ketobacteraceae bacterium]|nr:response regulator [Ketobacteraceae bacterium]